MTRYFYDTEFLEDGQTIELISIGIVDEFGQSYYAVNSDMPVDRIKQNEWLLENVWVHLPILGAQRAMRTVGGKIQSFLKHPGVLDTNSTLVKPKWVIRNEVREFLTTSRCSELWADYGAYDHVGLAQLWGRMIDLPKGIPLWTHDVQQLIEPLLENQLEPPQQQGTTHNALDDAKHVRQLWAWGQRCFGGKS